MHLGRTDWITFWKRNDEFDLGMYLIQMKLVLEVEMMGGYLVNFQISLYYLFDNVFSCLFVRPQNVDCQFFGLRILKVHYYYRL